MESTVPFEAAIRRGVPRWRALPRVAAACAMLAVAAFTAGIDAVQTRSHHTQQRAAVLERLSTIAGRLQVVFNARAGLVHGLSAIVRASNGQIDEGQFQLFAQHLRANHPDVRSLQLAPDAVVRYIYPLHGNRQALGHNVRKDPARAEAVERAIRERRFVVAGPAELIQGGSAVIARLPIYLPNGDGAGDFFWGFATVILDFEPLLEVGGVTAETGRLRLAIRGRDGKGAAGEVFFGDADVLGMEPVVAEVGLPHGSWQLAAVPAEGWTAHPLRSLIWSGGLGMMIVTALLAHHLLATPQRLQEAVERATAASRDHHRRAEDMSDRARRANEDKSRFLAAASHDLQQPLAALRLFTGLLAEEPLGPRGRSILEKMETTLQNALDLLDSLVHASALDTGKVTPRMAEVAVRGAVRQILAGHEQAALAKGVELGMAHCARTGCRSLTCSDPVLLKRILGNLVSNAVRYTERGRIRVRCQCRSDRTLIFVSDTGPGISKDKLPHIFEEFYRGDQTHKGVGLGLAIVSKLADAMGHRVAVRSREGCGTVFMVVVPHVTRPGDEIRHVLLVEDDEDQLFAMQVILEESGFSVTPATTVDEALHQIAHMGGRPDIIVTDFQLGDGTGTELVRRVTAELGAIPALVVTSDVEGAQPHLPPGCRLLRKGCSPREIKEAVLRVA